MSYIQFSCYLSTKVSIRIHINQRRDFYQIANYAFSHRHMNILRPSYIHVLLEIPAWIDNWLLNDTFEKINVYIEYLHPFDLISSHLVLIFFD